MNEKIIEAIKTNSKDLYKLIGEWDSAGRYTLDPKFETASSKVIRTPSRAWPKSVYKHVNTAKYRKQLLELLSAEENIENAHTALSSDRTRD